MIQLRILSGKKAGVQSDVRHFPFRIGRAAGNDLQLEDDGIWDEHLVLEFQKQLGYKLTTTSEALAAVNEESVKEKILRNGDVISIGSAKLQFWLAAVPQRGLRLREFFLWVLVAGITLTQIALIYWFLK